MIQAKSRKEGGFNLSNRTNSLTLLEQSIVLEDQTIDQSGEYEADGIEVIYGTSAALVVWENIQIAYVMSANRPSSFEKSQFTPVDVLIINTGEKEVNKGLLAELLEDYDPGIVVVSSKTNTESFGETYKFEEKDSIKLNEQIIPSEGRSFYLLK